MTVLKLKPRLDTLQRMLTDRQEEVLDIVVGECQTYEQTAAHLGCSPGTVKRHMEDIHQRLELTGADRFKLARWYWRRKFNYADELI